MSTDTGVWREQIAVLKKQFPTIQLTSGFRNNSVVNGSGNLSYHARGMAVDVTPRMDIFEWIKVNYPNSKEIIYSPAGNRQVWNGKEHFYNEPTRGDHWDHVHWAVTSLAEAAQGGVPGAVVDAATDAISGASNAAEELIPAPLRALYAFYKFITTPDIWLRIAAALAGGVLIILVFMSAAKNRINLGGAIGKVVK